MNSNLKKISDILIDTTVLDLIARDYVKPPPSVYDMLPETEFLDEIEEEE